MLCIIDVDVVVKLLQARYQQHEKLPTAEVPSLIAFSPRDASPMQTAPVSLSALLVVTSHVSYIRKASQVLPALAPVQSLSLMLQGMINCVLQKNGPCLGMPFASHAYILCVLKLFPALA